MPSMKDMPQNMPPMGSMQMKMLPLKIYGISNGSGFATYLDCPDCQKAIDDSMRQQMREYLKNMSSSLIRSALGGPTSALTGVLTQALMNPALQQKLVEKTLAKEEREASLNQWTCRDAKPEKADTASPPHLLNAKATGKAKVGSEAANSYEFSIQDEESRMEMPVTLYVSASSGLPLKLEMSQPEATMVMEYYDFDAPIQIEVPGCMKK
jgi:hypothetical protein